MNCKRVQNRSFRIESQYISSRKHLKRQCWWWINYLNVILHNKTTRCPWVLFWCFYTNVSENWHHCIFPFLKKSVTEKGFGVVIYWTTKQEFTNKTQRKWWLHAKRNKSKKANQQQNSLNSTNWTSFIGIYQQKEWIIVILMQGVAKCLYIRLCM